jgi:pseudouridine-5'-phosphate glycosidase
VDADGIRGKDVTPFLLAHFHEATEGTSLRVNVDLVLANATLAARAAAALAELGGPAVGGG